MIDSGRDRRMARRGPALSVKASSPVDRDAFEGLSPDVTLGATGRGPASGRRLLIVSNRLPVTISREGSSVGIESSVGGLATGLRGPHASSNGWWIGWPGDLNGVDEPVRREVDRQLNLARTIPVSLTPGEIATFYEHVSNGVLWPLFHDRLDRLPLHLDGWDVYERVNARYAQAIAEAWRPGDLVWIHDYQLMRVPALLRAMLPEAQIGFFLHVPFPNPEMFLTLPVRKWLVEGMLGADLIGFHTRRYRGHFTAVLRRLFGLEMDADSHVRIENRAVQLGVLPIGVDAREIAARASARGVVAKLLELRAHPGRLILGVDRLDYSKGIVRRLASMERFLADHPEAHGRVRMVQIAVPTRGGVEAYQEFRGEVEAAVGRINGRFGTPGWTPIQYLHRTVDDETLLALYRAADVMLVTPLRDGMNLVAKEFVASRTDEDGVLVLSEFAGAAEEMAEALIVNPYDIPGVAAAIHRACFMDGVERRSRIRRLREQVMRNDVHRWASTFLSSLEGAGAGRNDGSSEDHS